MADLGIGCILWGDEPDYVYLRCCPQDTYTTDSGGYLVSVCTCDGDCECTCFGCPCDYTADDDA